MKTLERLEARLPGLSVQRGEADQLQRGGTDGSNSVGGRGRPSAMRFSTSSVLRPVKGRRPQSCS